MGFRIGVCFCVLLLFGGEEWEGIFFFLLFFSNNLVFALSENACYCNFQSITFVMSFKTEASHHALSSFCAFYFGGSFF